MHASGESLNVIRFEGELLPNWAQLLDVAARVCAVPEQDRKWFSKFVATSGVDDSRSVIARCEALHCAIRDRGALLFTDLQSSGHDSQPAQIIAAWNYALETMIQAARSSTTCSWVVQGAEEAEPDESGGDVSLRRV